MRRCATTRGTRFIRANHHISRPNDRKWAHSPSKIIPTPLFRARRADRSSPAGSRRNRYPDKMIRGSLCDTWRAAGRPGPNEKRDGGARSRPATPLDRRNPASFRAHIATIPPQARPRTVLVLSSEMWDRHPRRQRRWPRHSRRSSTHSRLDSHSAASGQSLSNHKHRSRQIAWKFLRVCGCIKLTLATDHCHW